VAEGTGACGVNCLVCGLFHQQKCSPCGPGDSAQAQKKLAAQLGLLGSTCPILQCAADRRVPHCSADCADYPCRRFRAGPYPFSAGYLDMQLRRRARAGLGPPPQGPGPEDTTH
jgi:hypothetical protein